MPPPFIIVQHGAPRIADELPQIRANRLAMIRQFWRQLVAYDKDSKYQISGTNAPKYGWLTKLLARAIYSPRVPIDFEWIVNGKYDPKELLGLVETGLAIDDDIIQQWFDSKQVMKLLRAADSYERMVLAIRCVCGEHESNQEARRYVESVLGKNWFSA